MPGTKGELPEDGPEVAVTREQFEAWTEQILRRIELPDSPCGFRRRLDQRDASTK